MPPPPSEQEPPFPLCAAVAAAASDLLAPDVPDPRLAPLRAHLADCPDCRAELALQASVLSELRELPVASDSRKSWAGVRLALMAERRESERREELAARRSQESWSLLLVAVGVSAALVRLSPKAASLLAATPALHLWLLPLLFLGFGALISLMALPLLRVRLAARDAVRLP